MMWSGRAYKAYRAALPALALLLGACSHLPPSAQSLRPSAGPVLSQANHISPPVMRSRSLGDGVVQGIRRLYIDPANCPAEPWQADRNNTLFVLRNALTQRGYQFTQARHQAQAIVRLHYRGIIAKGRAKPGQALQQSQALFERLSSERVCQHNGERVLPLHARPENVVSRLPVIRIELLERDSGQLLWQGEAAGHHHSARPSLNTQLLIVALSRQLPVQQTHAHSGLGFRYAIASADGERFMPVITEVIANSPAARAGLKAGDPLLSIEHSSTLNRKASDIMPLLLEPAATRLFSVQRPLGETPILVRHHQLIGMRRLP